MTKDYYSYIKDTFKYWAPVYDLATLPLSGIRRKVVGLSGATEATKVLDVCTGTGAQALAFGKVGCQVVGIDISDSMLSKAKKKNCYPNVTFQIADATILPFEDGYFDISCVSLALHDMPYEARVKVLDEMKRVGEKLVIVDYNIPKNRLHHQLHVLPVSLYETRYYRDFVRRDGIPRLLEQQDLKVLKEAYGLLDFFKIVVCEK